MPIDVGRNYRFTLTRKNAVLECKEQSVATPAAANIPPAALSGTTTGVFVENLTARFDWILVVNE